MKNSSSRLIASALLFAAGFVALSAHSVPDLVEFKAGDSVSAAAFNTNFNNIADSIAALDDQVADLQNELDEARSAAGYITLKNGKKLPYYRKVFTGTRTSTTTTIAHGISGNPATERRFIGCEVVVNYDSSGPRQTLNLNTPSGASTPTWCDMDDTDLLVGWYDGSSRDYQVSLEYTLDPLE